MNLPEDCAIMILKRHKHCWRSFTRTCRCTNLMGTALIMCVSGRQDEKMPHVRFTAFEILEPEAQAWVNHFRGIGAIAPAPAGESEPVRKKSQTTEV